MARIIYQLPISLYSCKLRLALLLKGAEIALHAPPGGSYRSEAYRAVNPAGTIPALIDEDRLLIETDVIIDYLDAAACGSRLLPADPWAAARQRMLSRLVDLRLEAAIRRLFGQIAAAGRDARLVADADAAITAAFALIEAEADRAGPFISGERPGLPDCGLTATLAWFEALQAPLALTAIPGPRAAQAFAAMSAHPALTEEIVRYRQLVADWISSR
jgi:glutathione S-transferase